MTPGVWLSLACADLTNTRRPPGVIECAKPVIDQLAAIGIATEISVARGGVE